MADEKPNPELVEALRNEVFQEIEREADLVASYARSAGEAAYRGDQVTLGVHLKQLRLCLLLMIKLFKEGLENGGPKARSGADRPPDEAGDGMGGDQSQ
jgi:hypothetical protein